MQTDSRVVDPNVITVAVCHSDPLTHLGVVAVLRGDGRFQLLADVPSTLVLEGKASAVSQARVVVCDYETAWALVRHSWGRNGLPRIMVITSRDREVDVQSALSHGILGYVLCGCRVDEVTDGVMALGRGQRFLAAGAAQRIADRLSYQALTNRETEVLRFVVSGWTNKMIANELGVAEGTVKTHVKAILEKLGGRTRTEAANMAIRRGLVSPEGAWHEQGPSSATSRMAGVQALA